MKLSKGRDEDNYDIYNFSITLWNDIRHVIKEYLRKNNFIGGNYGIIDPWCLLIIQYYLVKEPFVHTKDIKRTLEYKEVYELMKAGYYNNLNELSDSKLQHESKILESKVFFCNNNLYDSKYIVDRINNGKFIKEYKIKLILKNHIKKKNSITLNLLKNKLRESLTKYLNEENSLGLSEFLINSMPEIYLNEKKKLSVNGIKEIIKLEPKSFIRTSSTIIDNDLTKILASELKSYGTKLYTIFHGGNDSEIAYNSQYKIDDELSEKHVKVRDPESKNVLVRYSPRKLSFKKGIVMYLKERNFQNTFLFGSETYEDQSKYMYDILDLLNKLKKSKKKDIIIMRHNDCERINLYELFLHLKKNQIFPMNSIKKKFYRRFFIPKLQIATYTGTVFIESILSNIPCILFFNPNRYQLSSEMFDLIEVFKEAKIFHSNSQSLSKFINKTNNFNDWWEDNLTKKAIQKFSISMKSYF